MIGNGRRGSRGAQDALAERNADGKPGRPAAKLNLSHLPDRLPRIKQVIEPAPKICPCGCTEMVKAVRNGSTSLPPASR